MKKTIKNNNQGKFIVFEGLDGSGTTTQARLLRDWFEKEGQPIYLTREPSDGPIGVLIRLALSGRLVSSINDCARKIDEKTLALFFAADRMDHLQSIIRPKLEQGINVISDRYYLSSFAYQTLTVDIEWIKQINSKSLRPDLTFLLDVPAVVCKKRMAKERWHIDLYDDLEKLVQIRDNYLNIAESLRLTKENILVLEGNMPIRDIFAKIKRHTKKLITKGFLDLAPSPQPFLFPPEKELSNVREFRE